MMVCTVSKWNSHSFRLPWLLKIGSYESPFHKLYDCHPLLCQIHWCIAVEEGVWITVGRWVNFDPVCMWFACVQWTEPVSSAHEVTDYCVRSVMNNTLTGKRNNKSKRKDWSQAHTLLFIQILDSRVAGRAVLLDTLFSFSLQFIT